MLARLLKVCFSLFLILYFSHLYSQNNYLSLIIYGYVKDTNGNSLKSVKIDLYETTSQILIASNITDNTGYYELTNMPLNTFYDIKATPPQNTKLKATIIRNILVNETNRQFDIILHPITENYCYFSGIIKDKKNNSIKGSLITINSEENGAFSTIADENGFFSILVPQF